MTDEQLDELFTAAEGILPVDRLVFLKAAVAALKLDGDLASAIDAGKRRVGLGAATYATRKATA